jgi:hypothetical protein
LNEAPQNIKLSSVFFNEAPQNIKLSSSGTGGQLKIDVGNGKSVLVSALFRWWLGQFFL